MLKYKFYDHVYPIPRHLCRATKLSVHSEKYCRHTYFCTKQCVSVLMVKGDGEIAVKWNL